MISFRKEYVIRILQKIRWQQNSSRLLIRILVGNFSGKYIRWFWYSLSISIRILFGITAAYFLIRIPVWKRLIWRIMQPIGKVEKMSTEFFKNSDESSRILIRILVGNFSGKYISWSLSIPIRIMLKFFKNFDQNTGGKI